MEQRGCVLLDRDGTVNVECHYLSSPDQVELLPHAAKGLRHLSRIGLKLAIVTNQSGIARGYFDQQRLEAIHGRLRQLLRDEHVEIDAIYHCPHHPDDHCDCRKPQPGMGRQAMQDFCCSPDQMFVIGDKPCDVEFGNALQATTFLVRTGYGREMESAGKANSNYVVDDLWSAAREIEQLVRCG
jgi:D-glycero-D-manno-heptose 1,7-bisphosphate phosphatase